MLQPGFNPWTSRSIQIRRATPPFKQRKLKAKQMKIFQVFSASLFIPLLAESHLLFLLHKTINHPDFPSNFEHISLLEQTICTSRQLRFRLFRNNRSKIGMNTTANKLHCLTDQINFDVLSLGFLHYKKLMKIQFLKFGNT